MTRIERKEDENIQEEAVICRLYGKGAFEDAGMSGAQDLGRMQWYKAS